MYKNLRRFCGHKRSECEEEICRLVDVMSSEKLSMLSKIIPKILSCECRLDCEDMSNDSGWEVEE